jgi:hypothetical protein
MEVVEHVRRLGGNAIHGRPRAGGLEDDAEQYRVPAHLAAMGGGDGIDLLAHQVAVGAGKSNQKSIGLLSLVFMSCLSVGGGRRNFVVFRSTARWA